VDTLQDNAAATTRKRAPAMPTPRLILASGSPQRRTLLAEAGYKFDIVVPRAEVECGICSTGGPATLVTELAVSKSADVAAQLKDRGAFPTEPTLIIACDTVAELGGMILGKPADEDHARNMLERLRGSVHRVYSGLCLWPLASVPKNLPSASQPSAEADGRITDGSPVAAHAPDVRLAVSELRMDQITDDQLDEYLASGLWRGKAGAFGFQDRAGWLHLTSGTESNVVGLPMELLTEMLAAHGVLL
jgi:septum formation protein